MTARSAIWDSITTDPTLNSLGINADNVLGMMAPDSPRIYDLWIVMHWGTIEVGPGRDSASNVVNLSVWAYNTQPDYGPVLDVLKRVRAVLLGIEARNGISSVQWTGDSEDLWDDGYRAITRNSNYRIAASGD